MRILSLAFLSLGAALLLAMPVSATNFPDPPPVSEDPPPVADGSGCCCVSALGSVGTCGSFLCPANGGRESCEVAICGPVGCSGPNCGLVTGSFSSSAPLAYSLRSTPQQFGHTHQCSRCSYVWDHSEDNGTHVCPKCKTFSNRVSGLPPTRSFVSYSPGPASLWESGPGTRIKETTATTSTYSYSQSTGCGTASGSSSGARGIFRRAADREPVLRIFGGPGVVRSVFGGRGCR